VKHPQLSWSGCALAVTVCCGVPRLAAAPGSRLSAAIPAIESTIKKSGAEVAVAFRTLDGRTQWYFHADEPFHAASTMKVAVLIELYRQVRRGKVKLSDALVVRNEFHSLADGSPYTLDPDDDSERDLYQAVGETRTLAQLSDLMITVSSNLATNLLLDELGVDNIRATVHALHADGMNVLRGVEDSKAFQQGLNNTTTARALLRLMQAIARGRAVDPDASHQMIEILERQSFNNDIPAGLPPGTRVAHKTGEITRIQHDAAIVFARRPFVLVILTRGLDSASESGALIAEITRQLYAASQ
jgi:beta-lactamase class A